MNNKLLYSNVHIHGDNNTVGIRTGVEGQDIREWIGQCATPVDFATDFRTEHFASGLRDRIMSNQDFQACLEAKSQTFVLIGKAGIGKTTAVRGLLRHLRQDRPKDKVLLAAIFYRWSVIDKLNSEAHKPSKVMMRLLMDIIKQIPEREKAVQQFYKDHHPGCPTADETRLVITAIINQAMERGQQSCIFIDGVDECNGEKNLATTLQLIRQIQKDTRIGLMLTDRLREKASWRQHCSPPSLCVVEEERASDIDIEKHIIARLKDSTVQEVFTANPLFFDEVVGGVKSASAGIFLLADSNVKHIVTAEAKTESEVRRDLSAIMSNNRCLSNSKESFVPWLERVSSNHNPGHDSRIARRVLRYVRDALRPLTVPELQHAITWDLEKGQLEGVPREWDDIRRTCRGLVELDDNGAVKFYHGSFGEVSEDSRFFDKLPKAHTELGNICIQYISQDFSEVADLADEVRRAACLYAFPLLRYASQHWAEHLKESPLYEGAAGDVEQFHSDTYEFLRLDAKVEFSLQVARYDDMLLDDFRRTMRSFRRASSADAPTFHELSVSRTAVGLFDPLLDNVEDLEDVDPFAACRTTGLHLACRLGLRELAKRLVEGGKACESKDSQLRTPLHVAATFDREDIIDDLLQHGVTADPRDRFGYSPLMSAAHCGATAAAERLLTERLVHINAQTASSCSIYKRSALHLAAARGHLEVLNILLSHRDANLDLRDSHGEAALHLAVKTRSVEVFKCFELASMSIADCRVRCHSRELGSCPRCGCSVLHLAALDRNATPLVKHILKHYPELRTAPDANRRIPLHYAVSSGASRNVETLLNVDGANQANVRDWRGWPPLIEAINSRHNKLFEQLWTWPGFRQDERLADGQTYREYAEKHGNDAILHVLQIHSPAPSRQGTLKQNVPDNIIINTTQWNSRDKTQRRSDRSGINTPYKSSRAATPLPPTPTSIRKTSIPWPRFHTPRTRSPSNYSEKSKSSPTTNAHGPTSPTYAQATKPSELRKKSSVEDRIDMSPTRRRRPNPKYREFGAGSASGLKAK